MRIRIRCRDDDALFQTNDNEGVMTLNRRS